MPGRRPEGAMTRAGCLVSRPSFLDLVSRGLAGRLCGRRDAWAKGRGLGPARCRPADGSRGSPGQEREERGHGTNLSNVPNLRTFTTLTILTTGDDRHAPRQSQASGLSKACSVRCHPPVTGRKNRPGHSRPGRAVHAGPSDRFHAGPVRACRSRRHTVRQAGSAGVSPGRPAGEAQRAMLAWIWSKMPPSSKCFFCAARHEPNSWSTVMSLSCGNCLENCAPTLGSRGR